MAFHFDRLLSRHAISRKIRIIVVDLKSVLAHILPDQTDTKAMSIFFCHLDDFISLRILRGLLPVRILDDRIQNRIQILGTAQVMKSDCSQIMMQAFFLTRSSMVA